MHAHTSDPAPSRLSSLPLAQGYAILALSIVFNGLRYNLDSAALKVRSGSAAPMSTWMVVAVGSYAAAAAFFAVSWIWRRNAWSLGSLQQVSWESCRRATREQGWLVLLAALGGSSGGWFLTESNKLYGPEFTAFLGNLMPVLLILSGIGFGERLRRGELIAIGITVLGAFVFSYRHGRLNWAGIGLMVAGCVLMAMKKILMKHATGVGHLPSVMTLSLLFMGTWAFLGGLLSGELQFGTPASIGCSVAGGVSGAMIGMSLLYAGLNVVGLARGAPIDSLRPLAVLGIGLAAGSRLPGSTQLLGGAMVLFGSVALARMASGRAATAQGVPSTAVVVNSRIV